MLNSLSGTTIVNIIIFRVWTHCAQNAARKNRHNFLRGRWYSSDAAMPVQYRRCNGPFIQVYILEDLLLQVHAASQAASNATSQSSQFSQRYTISWVSKTQFEGVHGRIKWIYLSVDLCRGNRIPGRSRTTSFRHSNRNSQKSADSALGMSEGYTRSSYSDTECR